MATRTTPSYQNSNGEGSLQRIKEIGLSPEQLRRRKNTRRLLFTTLSILLLATLAALATVVNRHQRQAIEADLDDYFYNLPGTGATTRPPASLHELDARSITQGLPSGCETTIILMRHCEKLGPEILDSEGNEHCSYLGLERAHFLPTLFGDVSNKDDAKSKTWPIPAALYALTPQRQGHLNFREVELLLPMARQFGLEINYDVTGNKDIAIEVMDNLSTGDWCGEAIVVSWKHDKIGDLAKRLGCVDCPAEYPDGVFDTVWQLKYVYDALNTPVVQAFQRAYYDNDFVNLNASSGLQHGQPTSTRRELKKGKKHKRPTHTASADVDRPQRQWSVYSTITHQGFDPLHFSAKVGDYAAASGAGGQWFTQSCDGCKSEL